MMTHAQICSTYRYLVKSTFVLELFFVVAVQCGSIFVLPSVLSHPIFGWITDFNGSRIFRLDILSIPRMIHTVHI